jgi:DNA-binding NarL/FixJ family response regulator
VTVTANRAAEPGERLVVQVRAAAPEVLYGLVAKLHQAGFALAKEPGPSPDMVLVAAASTVHQAIELYGPASWPRGPRLLVVADAFSPAGTLHAVRAGVRVMLRSAEADSRQLAAAVRAARHGECRMPHYALMRLLAGAPEPPGARQAAAPAPVLTPRQTTVLKLMAEGLSNAGISRALSVSEHTVKNVSYDMMARLQVRNRAHAVAHAVQTGLI